MDKKFFYGAPLRLMGRFYHQCPGWPIGSGDTNKALKLLTEAVKLGPEFMLNHLYLADILYLKRKKDQAAELIEQIVDTMPEDTPYPKYHLIVQDLAKQLKNKKR